MNRIFFKNNGLTGSTPTGYKMFGLLDGSISLLNETGSTEQLGSSVTTTINKTIDLSILDDQFITIPTGTYIIDKAYLSGASIDLSTSSASSLTILSGSNSLYQSLEEGPCLPPGCEDFLSYLYTPSNYIQLTKISLNCWPPPCNGDKLYTEGDVLTVNLTTASNTPATANLSLILTKLF